MSENLKENWKPIFLIVIVLVLAAVSAYPQQKFGGRVVEVIDGKTCVIDMGNGRVTAVLQYIEIPAPEQPLYETVKAHLEELVLEKKVLFKPRQVLPGATVGLLVVNGVDVSRQMLRDGAAWYSVPDKDRQEEAERLIYQDNEAQAQAEKRGLWSVENLKPFWEDGQNNSKQSATLLGFLQGQNRPNTSRDAIPLQDEMWAIFGDANKNSAPSTSVGGLLARHDSQTDTGYLWTPGFNLNFPKSDFLRKVESRLFYVYKGDRKNIEESLYVIGFLTVSGRHKFVSQNGLTITADSGRFNLGKARRYAGQTDSAVWEMLFYKVTRADLMKIAKAKKISVRIAGHQGEISKESLKLFNNLLSAS